MTTDTQKPVIESVNGKIAVLERRVEYLKRKLESDSYASSASADFDKAELNALRAAIKAMRYHSALGDAKTDPVLALQALYGAVTERLVQLGARKAHGEHLYTAIEHAERVLREVSVAA